MLIQFSQVWLFGNARSPSSLLNKVQCEKSSSHADSVKQDTPPALALDRIALAFCLAAILYLLVGIFSPARQNVLRLASLPQVNPKEPALSGSGFAPNAAAHLGRPGYIKGPLQMYGSFLDNGDSTGSVHTAEFQAVPDFLLFVSGFPNRPGNRLLVEVSTKSGLVRLSVAPFEDPASRWLLKRISLRAIRGAQSFRIIATDSSRGQVGWLGFSLPFENGESRLQSSLLLLKQLGFSILAMAASFVALLAPGFIARQKIQRRRGQLFSIIWIAVPGLLALALLGVAAWFWPSWFGPRHIKAATLCRLALLIFFAYATWHFLRFGFSRVITATEQRVLLIVLVLAAICAAKSIYSLGPVGELFHDEISRTLEIGGRSDSRLPYYVAQLVGLRQRPASPLARTLYDPWTFSDRGQLVALAAAPLVLAGPVSVPDHAPSDLWTVFDAQGFSAYRFSMIVFAACTLLFVFGVSALFVPTEWALLAVLVVATSPFFVHDIYFTWPKLEAAAFVLLAAYLVLQSRFFLAGFALGVGYLCHPSALLSAPTILFLIALAPRSGSRKFGKLLRESLAFLVGLFFWLACWRIVNGSNYSQGKFLDFAFAAGNLTRTPAHWFSYRLTSLLNTLVPLNQFLFHAHDENVNAIERPSPAIVRFFVQPWSAVPFAVGGAWFFCLLRLLYLGFLKARSWLLLVLLIPLLIFTAYMGIDSSGMLKEGLHAWFLTLLIFSVIVWKKFDAQSQSFWKVCNYALLSRVVDLLLMMLLPAVSTQHSLVRASFTPTDVAALCTMIVGVVWLCVYMFNYSEGLRLAEAAIPMPTPIEKEQ